MKFRNKKAAVILFTSALILCAGTVRAEAAESGLAGAASADGTGAPAALDNSLFLTPAEVQDGTESFVETVLNDGTQIPEKEKPSQEEWYASLGVVQSEDGISVYGEPSEDGEVVGVMADRSVATVEEETDGWYRISSGEIGGFVRTADLTVGDRELIDSVRYREAEILADGLKIHAQPALDAPVVSVASSGDRLRTLEVQADGWIRVETAGGEGYLSAEYANVHDTFLYAQKPEAACKGSSVIDFALQFVGNPYQYGGSSLTNGTDCSGFVMSVYANFGVSLPHSSSALRSVGTEVSYADAQPGDIICYSGHVALYIGNGQIVHASTKKDGIKVSGAEYKPILTVRRIFP